MNNNLYDGYNKSRKICCKIEHEIGNLHGYSHNYYRYIKIELPSVLEFLDFMEQIVLEIRRMIGLFVTFFCFRL